jgi:hypothetical protein
MLVVAVGLAVAALLLAALAVFLRRPGLGKPDVLVEERARADALAAHLEMLAGTLAPRDVDHPENLELAAAYVEARLREATPRVASERYEATFRADLPRQPVRNLVASFGPENGPRVVVGAHYDAFGMYGSNPGADDNASGTAGLLELARLLRGQRLARRVDLVAFTLEEPPFFGSAAMGSRVRARALRAAGVEVEAMIGLEMIGYFSARQPWPSALLALVYPRRGDFAGVVGRPLDRGLARRVKRWMRVPAAAGNPAVPVYSFNGPTMMGTDASDHASFWLEGFPAVMVTDTAFMRNPHYHGPGDRPETLDYPRMATIVDGVLNAVLHLAGGG